MTDKEKYELWQYTTLSGLSDSLSLVQNNYTGALMLLRATPADTYPVMRILSGIRDDNLMTVYDTFVDGGVCLTLCEYIEGVTLEDAVRNNGVFSEEETKRVAIAVCRGLNKLHEHGVIHRDIKPSNVICNNRGTVKIIDYDITRMIKAENSKDTHVLGTVGFASPEQFGFKQTDARSDIYSVGVLMNYLLTGELPDKALYDGKLRPVIERCIEMDAENRYSSADQLIDVLTGKLRYDAVVSLSERRSRPFRPLPGFRGTKVFPKIIAGFFLTVYFLMVIVETTVLIKMFAKGDSGAYEKLYMSVNILVMFTGLPYILFGDVFYISEKIYPSNPARGKQITKVLGALSIIAGIVMAYYYSAIFF